MKMIDLIADSLFFVESLNEGLMHHLLYSWCSCESPSRWDPQSRKFNKPWCDQMRISLFYVLVEKPYRYLLLICYYIVQEG